MSENEKNQSGYETFAQTVGVVPSLNVRDNLYQGIFVAVCTLLLALGGLLMFRSIEAALVGALIGLIGSGLLSGLVLMVLGIVRAAKRGK